MQVGATIPGIGSNTNYSQSVISGKSMSMTKTDQLTRAEFVNSGHDSPDRGGDTFDLWMKNVKLSYYDSPYNNWSMLQGVALDTRRYQLVNAPNTQYAIFGPNAPGDPIEADTFAVSYNQSNDVVNGAGVNSSTTVLAGINLGVVSIGGSQTWTESYTDVRTTTAGAQNTASLTLRTPTAGCFMPVNVYIDAVFGTYLALPVPGAATHCNQAGVI